MEGTGPTFFSLPNIPLSYVKFYTAPLLLLSTCETRLYFLVHCYITRGNNIKRKITECVVVFYQSFSLVPTSRYSKKNASGNGSTSAWPCYCCGRSVPLLPYPSSGFRFISRLLLLGLGNRNFVLLCRNTASDRSYCL
jgi:hypothetical protein